MKDRQQRSLEPLTPNLHAACSGNDLPNMSRKEGLIAALKIQAQEADQTKEEDDLHRERERCLSMSLAKLDQEKVACGKYAGKAVSETTKDPRYVLWLLNHHGENVQYQNIMIYAQRKSVDDKNAKSSSDKPPEPAQPA